jgi:hypothetical protein
MVAGARVENPHVLSFITICEMHLLLVEVYDKTRRTPQR